MMNNYISVFHMHKVKQVQCTTTLSKNLPDMRGVCLEKRKRRIFGRHEKSMFGKT